MSCVKSVFEGESVVAVRIVGWLDCIEMEWWRYVSGVCGLNALVTL